VVLHSKKSLQQKAGDQQYFFYQVMQRGQLLFQEKARPPYLSYDALPARNVASAKRYFHQRKRTNAFLMKAEALDSGGATKIHIYFLHLIVEQTCLGLIRLFLGYMPNHFSLWFLLELCDYFTSLSAELFPREMEKDKERLRILSGCITSLRYGSIDGVSSFDYEVLSNRCTAFVAGADKLAIKELERLEELN
jgi:hypothetical protein